MNCNSCYEFIIIFMYCLKACLIQILIILVLNRQVEGETRVGVFAARSIEVGEPLTYDYRYVKVWSKVYHLPFYLV